MLRILLLISEIESANAQLQKKEKFEPHPTQFGRSLSAIITLNKVIKCNSMPKQLRRLYGEPAIVS